MCNNRPNKHKAKKKFGQNFLIDQNLINKIVASFNLQKNDQVLEIGPGLGALTKKILEKVEHINVVEIDRDLIAKLKQKFESKINIHSSDILKFDLNNIELSETSDSLRIIGNLPYNISTPILFHLFKSINKISDMMFMLQLEVVDRITAQPNNKDYGRLSIMTQLLCETRKVLSIPATAFKPQPKVESAIVYLKPRKDMNISELDIVLYNKIVTAAFNQRRKTLGNSLKRFASALELTKLGIDPQSRAENLSLNDYTKIYNMIRSKTK